MIHLEEYIGLNMRIRLSKAVCCILISCVLCGCGAETNAQTENYELADIALSESGLSETEKEEKYNEYIQDKFQEDVEKLDGIEQADIVSFDENAPTISIQLTFSEELQPEERETLKDKVADYAETIWENCDVEITETNS